MSRNGSGIGGEERAAAALLRLLACSLLCALACSSPPLLVSPRDETTSLSPPATGALVRLSSLVRERAAPGESGFLPLAGNADALRWRLALIDSAVSTIDLQTYLWKNDATGRLLVRRLVQAAKRGVRVRVLADDFLAAPDGRLAAALSQHPHLEVRFFNPFHNRERRNVTTAIEWLRRPELNHRMHNKLLVTDGLVAVAGGRNMADEYFGLNERQNFADLDVIAVGPVVEDFEHAFDDYWNDEWAVPAAELTRVPSTDDALGHGQLELSEAERVRLSSFPLERSDWSQELDRLAEMLRFGRALGVTDDPRELRGGLPNQVFLSLGTLLEGIERELLLVSAYFVPDADHVATLASLVAHGVRVRVFTNSLASNNHSVVNSQYKKWRRPLLEAGVELYEMRHDPRDLEAIDTPPVSARSHVLHTKAVLVDRHRAYVGALNLSPRGVRINAENGLLIDSADIGAQLSSLFEEQMQARNAWRVRLEPDGSLTWESADARVRRQPARTTPQRMADWFYGLFPLAGQI